METKKIAQRIANVCKDKKAQKIVILDIQKVASFCDYFVIASCDSLRQTGAVSKAISDDLDAFGIKPLSKVPREDESGWTVIDFGSVIAHIFYKPMREFYSLESLWSDGKRVRVSVKP